MFFGSDDAISSKVRMERSSVVGESKLLETHRVYTSVLHNTAYTIVYHVT